MPVLEKEFREAMRAGEQAGSRYMLETPREAGSHGLGSRLGSRRGQSLDFQDYRDYQPGDDLRWVDWSAYARSDRLSVKLFHEEVSPRLDLILDTSRSMALPGTAKFRGSLVLASMLATAAVKAGFALAVWRVGNDGFVPVSGAVRRPSEWEAFDFDGQVSVAEAFEMKLPRLGRRGLRFLVSDLMWEAPPEGLLRRLAADSSLTAVLQVLAQQDADPGERGFLEVIDSEDGERFDLHYDAMARRIYLEAFETHQASWREACRRYAIPFIPLFAEDLARHPSLDMLVPAGIVRAG